jgi:enterochelin esterase-like enzyme
MRLSLISPGFLAMLALLAAGAWVGWRFARRHHRAAAVMALTGALVLSTAGAASAVNTYYGYLPTVDDVVHAVSGDAGIPRYPLPSGRAWPRGVVVRLPVPDRGSGFGASQALAYLPPQYFTEPARRFGVVYLVHGSPGVPGDWFRGGQAANAAAAAAAGGHPVIVVAPRMSHGWLDDPECVDGTHERIETHFLRDVLPAVDGSLRTLATRQGRTLGGMSAGGYCALNLGLRHRDLIGTILDLSGDVAPTHTGGLPALFGRGAAAQAAARANTPASYAADLAPAPPTRIWFDCGTADRRLLAGIHDIAVVLAARGFPVQLHVRPGGHTFHVWQPALRQALTWTAEPTGTGG